MKVEEIFISSVFDLLMMVLMLDCKEHRDKVFDCHYLLSYFLIEILFHQSILHTVPGQWIFTVGCIVDLMWSHKQEYLTFTSKMLLVKLIFHIKYLLSHSRHQILPQVKLVYLHFSIFLQLFVQLIQHVQLDLSKHDSY